MKQKIKVTIGLCIKNVAATVGEAIDSILNQEFPRELMELIVVDGYSRDGTLEIAKGKLMNSGIRTKIFREDEGLGHARQIVVDNAEGDYIIWVDGDMVLTKDFVTKQLTFMERNPRAGIAKGKYGIGNGGNLVAVLEDIYFASNFEHERETNLTSVGASGCIYRVNAIRQIGGFDPNIKGAGEDTDVEIRMKSAGWSVCITSAVFYEKRRNGWKALWNEYFWHGAGASYIFTKNRGGFYIYKMLPPVAIFMEVLRVPVAYKLTRKSIVFLLPFHYLFKRIAWFLGFIKGRISLFD